MRSLYIVTLFLSAISVSAVAHREDGTRMMKRAYRDSGSRPSSQPQLRRRVSSFFRRRRLVPRRNEGGSTVQYPPLPGGIFITHQAEPAGVHAAQLQEALHQQQQQQQQQRQTRLRPPSPAHLRTRPGGPPPSPQPAG